MRTRQRMVERRVRRKRVIFFHIPKCAGISVSEHFSLCAGNALSLREDLAPLDFDRQVERARHAPFVTGHFGWGVLERVRGDAMVFTVLRDPLIRLRSQYYFHLSRDCRGFPPVIRGRQFTEYLDSQAEADNMMARQLAASARYDQTSHLTSARLEAMATEHLRTFDYVGFVDSLSTDLIEMCRMAGFYVPKKAPWLNHSPFAALSAADRTKALAVSAVDRTVYSIARDELAIHRPSNPANCAHPGETEFQIGASIMNQVY